MRLDHFKIYCIMAKRGITQKELSESAGYSREAIRKAINGKVDCRPPLTGAISQALGVEPEEIIMNNQ